MMMEKRGAVGVCKSCSNKRIYWVAKITNVHFELHQIKLARISIRTHTHTHSHTLAFHIMYVNMYASHVCGINVKLFCSESIAAFFIRQCLVVWLVCELFAKRHYKKWYYMVNKYVTLRMIKNSMCKLCVLLLYAHNEPLSYRCNRSGSIHLPPKLPSLAQLHTIWIYCNEDIDIFFV